MGSEDDDCADGMLIPQIRARVQSQIWANEEFCQADTAAFGPEKILASISPPDGVQPLSGGGEA